MREQKCEFPPDDRAKGVPLTMEFLASPALYAMGLAERRVLDVLELAYLDGAENGRLVVLVMNSSVFVDVLAVKFRRRLATLRRLDSSRPATSPTLTD